MLAPRPLYALKGDSSYFNRTSALIWGTIYVCYDHVIWGPNACMKMLCFEGTQVSGHWRKMATNLEWDATDNQYFIKARLKNNRAYRGWGFLVTWDTFSSILCCMVSSWPWKLAALYGHHWGHLNAMALTIFWGTACESLLLESDAKSPCPLLVCFLCSHAVTIRESKP